MDKGNGTKFTTDKVGYSQIVCDTLPPFYLLYDVLGRDIGDIFASRREPEERYKEKDGTV
jgi:hypothetical protein